MVPTPNSPFTYDYWATTGSDVVELICLLPNSVYIPMEINWNATVQDIKVDLWEKASCYPLFGLLRQMSTYVFQFVNSLAVTEEIEDETTRIRDIKPICGVFIIVEKSYERPGEQLLNTHISHLIGKLSSLTEFDNVRSSEVNDFRMRMRYLAEQSLIRRAQSTSLERLRYQYPPRLANSSEIPTTLKTHLKKQCFILVTKFENTEFSLQSIVPATRTPQQYIDIILRTSAKTLSMRVKNPLNYVLKVCGREEYIFGDYPLIQFLYIQEMLSTDAVPEVLPIEISQLMLTQQNMRPYPYCLPERRRMTLEHSNSMRKKKIQSSWNINKDYSCIVHSVNNLNVDATQLSVEVVCQAGIFHGGKALCQTQETRPVVVSRDGAAQWDQELTFPIKVYNLPRMSRVCFGVYEITKSRGKRRGKDANKEGTRLAWANTMIFDYKDQLQTDCVTLSMWTHVADDMGDALVLHPLDTVVPNPNTESSATLQVYFSNYDCKVPVLYPEDKIIDEYSKHADNVSPNVMVKKANIEQLRATAKVPLYEMYEQDKKFIWASRERFRTEAPEVLPKLLSCVEWDDRTEVATVRHILARWPMLRVEFALELLDYAYADCAVRSFAVKCLSKISDNDLLLYLLQLVQALKHESYLMCDLSTFLLKRAFKNITIGRYLFWYLRSEMQVPSVSMRFGLLLEAYCRGSQEHIHSFMKQISCLDKLKWVREHVKKKKDIRQARALLVEYLQEKHCQETLRDFVSPLNPTFVCKSIKPKSCRVMDSKMRPLMLEFENGDSMGSNIRIILKIGDDLRQDMFTLQMLRIMDKLWKSHGYDFRLNPYNCISMDYMMGMIEVVEESETVANIQKQSAMFNAASAFKKSALYQWLIKVTENKKKLSKTVDEFTMSCAGYSVATYVLGIADRHPDNIMLKKNGQLFHIDFGHFLGHFKHKYGFKRERVPFVLPYDFIHVINKGQKGTGDKVPMEFKIFRDHCETAFKILRKHGHLILSLFSMMISTGLPELSSEKDLQYLRDTLVMDLSEEKAMEHFRQKFNEALKNSWTTSINWWIHNVAGGQIVPAQS